MSEQFPYGTLTWTTEAQMACKALEDAYGLPPDNLEEYVRALVREAGEAERFLREVSPLLREANRDVGAVMIAQVLELALAPFAHLGGEP